MSSNLATAEKKFYFVKKYTDLENINEFEKKSTDLNFGPWRIKPGGLSVSRTFGDIESKVKQFGGNENTVIPAPEITEFLISNTDFVFLASDGVFDQISN